MTDAIPPGHAFVTVRTIHLEMLENAVPIAFGRQHSIGTCFAFDADLKAAGLAPLG
jgi:hypothetical protein